jgi:hypothetical protein
MELSQDQMIIVLGILLGVSELIALNPKWKSNSVLQLVMSSIKKILSKKKSAPEQTIEQIAEKMMKEELAKTLEDEIKKLQ